MSTEPLKAYGIRFHGRRWLKFGSIEDGLAPNIGWRPYFWTADLAEAEKYASEDAAGRMGREMCSGPFEVAEITARMVSSRPAG